MGCKKSWAWEETIPSISQVGKRLLASSPTHGALWLVLHSSVQGNQGIDAASPVKYHKDNYGTGTSQREYSRGNLINMHKCPMGDMKEHEERTFSDVSKTEHEKMATNWNKIIRKTTYTLKNSHNLLWGWSAIGTGCPKRSPVSILGCNHYPSRQWTEQPVPVALRGLDQMTSRCPPLQLFSEDWDLVNNKAFRSYLNTKQRRVQQYCRCHLLKCTAVV